MKIQINNGFKTYLFKEDERSIAKAYDLKGRKVRIETLCDDCGGYITATVEEIERGGKIVHSDSLHKFHRC